MDCHTICQQTFVRFLSSEFWDCKVVQVLHTTNSEKPIVLLFARHKKGQIAAMLDLLSTYN